MFLMRTARDRPDLDDRHTALEAAMRDHLTAVTAAAKRTLPTAKDIDKLVGPAPDPIGVIDTSPCRHCGRSYLDCVCQCADNEVES